MEGKRRKKLMKGRKPKLIKKRSTKGITLIALVVTIVVLLILAGVTINMLFSDSGIIKKAQEAKEIYEEAQNDEAKSIENLMEEYNRVKDELGLYEIVEPDNVEDWEYIIEENGTVTLTSYKGSDTEVIVPNQINGKPVKKIVSPKPGYKTIWNSSICSGSGNSSTESYTEYQKTITKVVISSGIEEIGEWAFACSKALEQITIPGSVKSIGYRAFNSCGKLSNVMLGNGVKNIERQAFYYCSSLTNIFIPKSVLQMGSGVFGSSYSSNNQTVNVEYTESEIPKGWDADWSYTHQGTVTVNYGASR